MNVGVTVHAAACQRNAPTGRRAGRGKRRNGPAMAGGLVTLLAQEWLTPLEHACNGRTVRLMAKCAVLGDGLMVPDEGTAFFRVALKTGVVDGIAGHQTGASRSMRVMAVRAPNLALEDRMA